MPSPRSVGAFPHAAAVLMLVLLAACTGGDDAAPGRGGGGGARGGGGEDRPVPVTTAQVQPRAFSDTVQALGTVQARESVTLTAKVSETVERVHFDSGEVVKAGAPLITLSGQAQQASLREAQATAEEAERLFQRQNELAGQQLIARSQLDAQRATRDAARARVAQIRAQLGDRTIRAPFAGVLGLRQVSPGTLVTPGTVIATLDDTARVHVDFPVPETQLAQVAPGQALTATSAAYPGRRFDGTVATVDSRIDAGTRAVTVRGDFPNPERLLRPGMLMEVTLSQAERRALLVPEIAVVQVGSDSFVYRVKPDGSVERADVRTGARREGQVEITSGLAAGDRIVVDGTGKLRPGAKISEAGQRPAAGAPAGAAR
ncbi:efflux RND transporter periplasmic adaptor subunit [Lysobacter korlensis]|uniref:Efflux RND transporter periplasmic adaptor subunit n=1 Tax=Lysobacter korlensis TaxID=553636 RepID=A0ABV6RJ73_9GAMM